MNQVDLSFDRVVIPADYARLANQTDWANDRGAPEIRQALQSCHVVLGAWDDARLVGMARVISDGVYVAQIIDLVVDESYRSHGLGSRMMTLLLDRCAEIEVVMLTCGPDQEAFYRRFGFVGGLRMSRRSRP